jgi:tRNA(Ile2)-agmatinylcytidine synthase
VVSEPVDRWVLFRTNQGTGDHLMNRIVGDLAPFGSARIAGCVASEPQGLRGGHVRIEVEDLQGSRLTAMAFEPTKTLPGILQALVPGDRVELWGSLGSDPVMKLEGLRVIGLVPRWSPGTAPRCPDCVRSTKSLGTSRGFRCPECGRRFPPEAAARVRAAPPIRPGIYHPTPSARRHLAPLGPEPGRGVT